MRVSSAAAGENTYSACDFGSGHPQICITAGIHGDEVSGIYTAQRLIAYLKTHPLLRGSVRVIPIVNQAAYAAQSRRDPADNEDLNRIFPGDPGGSPSFRLARSVYDETEDAAMMVDLHCCGGHGLPYVLSVYSESDNTRSLVSSLSLPVAIHSQGTGGQLFVEAGRRRNQAACIIELPSAFGRGAINLPLAEQCLDALLDLFRSQGMLPGERQGKPPVLLGKLQDRETPQQGLWLPKAQKGTWVDRGMAAGELNGERICFESEGFLMSLRPAAFLLDDENWLYTFAPKGLR